MKKFINQKGQSLIEVLIALSASVVVVTAITVTVITSLSNAEFAKNQNLATQYSKEGLEVVRQIAKNNWTNFQTYTSTNYCLAKGSATLCARGSCGYGTPLSCGQNVDLLSREITIIQTSSVYCTNSVEIVSTVYWGDSKCQAGTPLCHQVLLRSCLADINSLKGL